MIVVRLLIPGILALGLASVLCAAPTNAPPRAPATHGSQTNAEPHFAVLNYEVDGNTLIPEKSLRAIMSKHTGTNVTFDEITSALKDLQLAYHDRGYDTVKVTIPQQRLTNGVFKIRVFEGRLGDIQVVGNGFFSSANVLRALPGLKTNMFLNSKLFQPELDRANANQDRQIYPEIRPGPESNTTTLALIVKDRLPLHAKIEANDQSSPGTPEQRLNTSIVYNNLWQREHSIGVQYAFSEEYFKNGEEWHFYDRPLVANYSTFYRLPLGAPDSMVDVGSRPGSFGYNEATRKFELPPASGTPELTIYASGSTIDSGVITGAPVPLIHTTTGSIIQETVHQDLTVNDGVGFRLSEPLPDFWGIRSRLQGGVDLKSYRISSFETNDFIFTEYLIDTSGNPFTRVTVTPSIIPPTIRSIEYLPLAARWDASRADKYGSTDFGLGESVNLWFSNTKSNLQGIAGSPQATGFWHVLSGSAGREQMITGQWKLALRADGQWASEPLISNEQFGVGGVNGVRGYREGEVLGDSGWRITSELKTPTHAVGFIGKGTGHALTVRASVFMDYADTYLLDPKAGNGEVPLWGAGVGGAASVGPNFEGRLLMAWPLLHTPASEAGQVRFAFALSAQF